MESFTVKQVKWLLKSGLIEIIKWLPLTKSALIVYFLIYLSCPCMYWIKIHLCGHGFCMIFSPTLKSECPCSFALFMVHWVNSVPGLAFGMFVKHEGTFILNQYNGLMEPMLHNFIQPPAWARRKYFLSRVSNWIFVDYVHFYANIRNCLQVQLMFHQNEQVIPKTFFPR